LKILHVINNLSGGGAEKLISDLSIYYKNNGLEVGVLILNDNNDKYSDLLLKEKIEIINLNQKNIYNPIISFKLIKYMKKYDVIHVHLFPTLYFCGFSKLFLKGKHELVYTEHSTYNRRRKNLFFKNIEKFFYSKYKKVISITDEVQENLLNWLNPEDKSKYIVIENGIDVKKYKNSEKYSKNFLINNLKEDDIIITMASRFSEQKDQKTVIKAFEKLPKNYHLILLGEGKLKSESQKLTDELSLNERVHFLGFRSDVPEIFKSSDIVVQSSNWEGFGLTAVEAMASGIPVIASDVDGLNNIVKNYGVLFEKGNFEDLINKILKLTKDKKYYHEICETCYKRAFDFDISNTADKYIEIYREVLK